MSVWYCIPSARPPEEAEKVLKLWRERGYKIALLRDWSADRLGQQVGFGTASDAPMVELVEMQYDGYAQSVNLLIAHVMIVNPQAEWFVTGGDDTEPDPSHSASEISFQLGRHFGEQQQVFRMEHVVTDMPIKQPSARMPWSTFGVCQPTGDRWTVNGPGTQPGIDLVAGSPWMGREFCRRINQGRGPLWPEYFHCGEDEELQEVATRLGIFWQRPDLTHFHNHWGRPREGERIGQADRMPEFLKRANSVEEWAKFKKLFAERKAAGFPGSEPIA